jgi:tetratricopeptide (TPR) repeat protein
VPLFSRGGASSKTRRTLQPLFNLGSIAVERQDWPAALGNLQRSLSRSAPTDSIVRQLFALIARCHQMLGDLPEVLNACSEGLRMDPDDAELHFRKAALHRKAGQPAEAEACWRRILTLKRPDQFCSVDQGIYGHLTLRNLAVLAEERGDRAESRRLWRMVLEACPVDPEAMSRGEASQRVEEHAANPAPTTKRPCSGIGMAPSARIRE